MKIVTRSNSSGKRTPSLAELRLDWEQTGHGFNLPGYPRFDTFEKRVPGGMLVAVCHIHSQKIAITFVPDRGAA